MPRDPQRVGPSPRLERQILIGNSRRAPAEALIDRHQPCFWRRSARENSSLSCGRIASSRRRTAMATAAAMMATATAEISKASIGALLRASSEGMTHINTAGLKIYPPPMRRYAAVLAASASSKLSEQIPDATRKRMAMRIV